MEGPKKQASLFSFFQKTPKSKVGPNGDASTPESNKKAPMKTETDSAWEVDINNHACTGILLTTIPLSGRITSLGKVNRLPVVASRVYETRLKG